MLDQLTLYIATAVASLVVGGLIAYAAATSERLAAPRRAKAPEDRTLTDKLIIEADRRIDMINIEQFEGFFASFVAAHLDTIIKSAPVIGPMATAADYVDDALEALHRRNPDLARALNPTKITVHEKLAGAIGKATKDQLAAALQHAGAPVVKP